MIFIYIGGVIIDLIRNNYYAYLKVFFKLILAKIYKFDI
jgi:hypothetical protein